MRRFLTHRPRSSCLPRQRRAGEDRPSHTRRSGRRSKSIRRMTQGAQGGLDPPGRAEDGPKAQDWLGRCACTGSHKPAQNFQDIIWLRSGDRAHQGPQPALPVPPPCSDTPPAIAEPPPWPRCACAIAMALPWHTCERGSDVPHPSIDTGSTSPLRRPLPTAPLCTRARTSGSQPSSMPWSPTSL